MKNAEGWNLPQGILHFRSLGLWTFLVLEDGIMWDLYGFVGFPFLCTLCMFYCNVAGWVVHRKYKLVILRSCLPWKMQGVGTSPKGSYIFGPLVFEHFWCWKMGLCGICMDLWGFHSFALQCCWVVHRKCKLVVLRSCLPCKMLEPPPRDLTFSVPWSLNIFGVGRWDYVGFVWICGVSIPLHFVHVLLQCCWVVHRKCKLVVLRSCLPWKMQGVGTSPKGSYIFGPLVFEHFWCWKMGLCGICMDLWGFHSFALCACFTAMLLGGWCIENVSWWSWGPVFHEKCRGLEPPPRDLTFSVPWSLNIFGVGRWDYVGFVWICGVSIPLHFVHVLLQCCWVGGA